MIAVLIPVLNRPANAAKVAASLAAATVVTHRLVFVVSPGDRAQRQACEETGATILTAGWQPGPGDYAKKMQLAYDLTDEPFVFTGADDLDFEAGWDTAALEAIERGPYGVCGTNDCRNPSVKRGLHATHSLVRRAYIDGMGGTFDATPGLLYSDAYDHQCVDNELLAVAQARGEWVFARSSHVIHEHPIWNGRRGMDATYEKALAHGREDVALFNRRHRDFLRTRRGALTA